MFSSNFPKLLLWCKNKNHYPLRWICITHIWFPRVIHKGIIIFQGVLTKLIFLNNFQHLENIVNLMKYLKHEHLSTFHLWGRVKLNLIDRYKKPNIYSRNSSCYQVFSSNSQKLSLWCKEKKDHYPPRWICLLTHKRLTLMSK